MRTYPRAIRDGIALLTVALALALAIGCSAPSSHDSLWQEPRALGTAVPSPLPPTDPALEDISTAVETPASLTIDDAIRLALTANPALAAAGWDVRGAEAAAWQAGLRPNPELALEAEEMLGSGELSGFDAFAASVVVEYEIALGGKRGKRVLAAEAQGRLAAWDYEATRLDVFTGARKAFLAAVIAQEQQALGTRTLELARGTLDTVTAQGVAGRSAAVERTRAEMTVAEAESTLRSSRNAVEASYKALAAHWGATEVAFERVDGSLPDLVEPPSAEAARDGLAEAPALARWADEFAALDAAVAAADAEGSPDIGVGIGGQYFRETKERSFLVELGVPLPLFDTNQGGVAEARAAEAKGRAEARQAAAATRAAFEQAYADLLSAYQEGVTARDQLMPRAQELLDKTMIGYKAGKFRYLEALIAQEELVETEQAYLQARATYALALADIERLIARELQDTE